jgi:hypothetical protein
LPFAFGLAFGALATMARHQDSRSSGQAIHQAVALRIAPNIAKLPELSNKPDRAAGTTI